MTTEVTQEVTPEVTTSQPEIGITDLQNLRAIVEVAAKRGVFAANELSSVGLTYDRLNAFLVAVMPAPEAAEVTEA